MPFRLHMVRHAEGTHNPSHDTTILDPPLTPLGIEQSRDLCRRFPYHQDVGLVIASPLRRTIQTALFGFQRSLDPRYTSSEHGASIPDGTRGRLLLDADVQPHSARPCDTGSHQAVLRAEFAHIAWGPDSDLGLDSLFPEKGVLYAPDVEAMGKRRRRVLQRLEEQFGALAGSARQDVVIVTHGGILDRFIPGFGKGGWFIENGGWKSFVVEFDADHEMIVKGLVED